MTNAVATIIHAVSPVSIFGAVAAEAATGAGEGWAGAACPAEGVAGGLVTASSAKAEMLKSININNIHTASLFMLYLL
jgi:hypothetical protein